MAREHTFMSRLRLLCHQRGRRCYVRALGLVFGLLLSLTTSLRERRALTPTTALLFEAALGVSSDLLMGMQTDYAMRLIKEDRSLATRLARIRESAALL